jgi:hypothetical protein
LFKRPAPAAAGAGRLRSKQAQQLEIYGNNVHIGQVREPASVCRFLSLRDESEGVYNTVMISVVGN